MDYSHVFDHPFDPRTVRVWDKLFLALDGEFVEVIYLDGPVTIIDDEHVVKVGDEIRLVNGQKLYQVPLGYIEDTAVYAGDRVRSLIGEDLVLVSAYRSAFVCAIAGLEYIKKGIHAYGLTLSKPRTKKTGFIALSPVYGAAPPEVHSNAYAQRHIFKSEAEAKRNYPNAHIVEVAWYDEQIPSLRAE